MGEALWLMEGCVGVRVQESGFRIPHGHDHGEVDWRCGGHGTIPTLRERTCIQLMTSERKLNARNGESAGPKKLDDRDVHTPARVSI